jgi:hypothetical protein
MSAGGATWSDHAAPAWRRSAPARRACVEIKEKLIYCGKRNLQRLETPALSEPVEAIGNVGERPQPLKASEGNNGIVQPPRFSPVRVWLSGYSTELLDQIERRQRGLRLVHQPCG